MSISLSSADMPRMISAQVKSSELQSNASHGTCFHVGFFNRARFEGTDGKVLVAHFKWDELLWDSWRAHVGPALCVACPSPFPGCLSALVFVASASSGGAEECGLHDGQGPLVRARTYRKCQCGDDSILCAHRRPGLHQMQRTSVHEAFCDGDKSSKFGQQQHRTSLTSVSCFLLSGWAGGSLRITCSKVSVLT